MRPSTWVLNKQLFQRGEAVEKRFDAIKESVKRMFRPLDSPTHSQQTSQQIGTIESMPVS